MAGGLNAAAGVGGGQGLAEGVAGDVADDEARRVVDALQFLAGALRLGGGEVLLVDGAEDIDADGGEIVAGLVEALVQAAHHIDEGFGGTLVVFAEMLGEEFGVVDAVQAAVEVDEGRWQALQVVLPFQLPQERF